MAITTVAGVISGLQSPIRYAKGTSGNSMSAVHGGWQYISGSPPAFAVNASGISGAACNSSLTGCIPFNNPVTGNSYIASINQMSTSTDGTLMIVDRLWHNSGLVVTTATAQTINSVAWPARDINASTNGEGVYVALEVSSVWGSSTPTFSMSYTNSAGTAGRTGTAVVAPAVTASTQNSFYIIGLQAGDTGVRSIQTFTLGSSLVSGVVHLVAFRPIVMMSYVRQPAFGIAKQMVEDAINLAMPRVFDNSCLMPLRITTSGSNHPLNLNMILTQG